MGPEGYKLIRNLCVPAKPRETSLKDLAALIHNHQNPRPNVISERFKFKQRKQAHGESIGAFVAALKQISLGCDFGDSLSLNLRDQIVWGLRSERIQRRLLAEVELTYDRAVQLCLSLEAAEKEARINQSSHKEGEATVNFLAKKKKSAKAVIQPACTVVESRITKLMNVNLKSTLVIYVEKKVT